MARTVRARLLAAFFALFLLAGSGLVAHAQPDGAVVDADARATRVVYSGIVGTYHDSKAGSEFYFDIPVHLARNLSPGAVLEPVSELAQRIVYYGGGIGFCIDAGVPQGTSTTVYRFNGMVHERALEAARVASARAVTRDDAVWAATRTP